MFFKKKRRVKRRQTRTRTQTLITIHYKLHKEYARAIITERLKYWNKHYGFAYNRVAIRNQKRCWGSCSEKQNLNFNYRLIMLPESLMDYVIVHELCHLAEHNHSRAFWDHVEQTIPDYKEKRQHLKRITNVPHSGFSSSVLATKSRL